MSAALLLKNGTIIDPLTASGRRADVVIENGRIKHIRRGISKRDFRNVIDLTGKYVMPGFIDMHVHLREPGFPAKETIESGCRAAVHGGVTTMFCMPNTSPPCDSPRQADVIRQNALACHYPNLYVMPTLTRGRAGKEMTDFSAFKRKQNPAFSDDGNCVEDDLLMAQICERAAKDKFVISQHCETAAFSREASVSLGELSEERMVARDTLFAMKYGAKIHFQHLSTRTSLELVRLFKTRYDGISCEVTPHHLCLTLPPPARRDGEYRVNPPLRQSRDRAALIEGIRDGTVDIIATDHAPHTAADKKGGYERAAMGFSGLETAFPVLYTTLCRQKGFGLDVLARLYAYNAAKRFSLKRKGRIQVGMDADVAVVDTHVKGRLMPSWLLSRGKNSPFLNRSWWGRVTHTVIAGQVMMADGHVLY
jgi:dihydroorotase